MRTYFLPQIITSRGNQTVFFSLAIGKSMQEKGDN